MNFVFSRFSPLFISVSSEQQFYTVDGFIFGGTNIRGFRSLQPELAYANEINRDILRANTLF